MIYRAGNGLFISCALAVMAGCASQQSIVDSMEPDATHVAQRRGAFELNCPAATASVLSKEMIQSPNVNPRFAPPQRAEYTVGIAGCGQRATYLVICAEGGTGCIATGTRNVVRSTKQSAPAPDLWCNAAAPSATFRVLAYA